MERELDLQTNFVAQPWLKATTCIHAPPTHNLGSALTSMLAVGNPKSLLPRPYMEVSEFRGAFIGVLTKRES